MLHTFPEKSQTKTRVDAEQLAVLELVTELRKRKNKKSFTTASPAVPIIVRSTRNKVTRTAKPSHTPQKQTSTAPTDAHASQKALCPSRNTNAYSTAKAAD